MTDSDASNQTETPSEACWSEALAEFQSSKRRAGLWAKVLSESAGNDNGAMAKYLSVRAHELHTVETIARKQLVLQTASQRAAAVASDEYALMSDGAGYREAQIIAICEAHLTTLGFEIRKPRPDKWEILGKGGTTFAYSADDLRRTTAGLTRGLL